MSKTAVRHDENASPLFPYDRYELEEAVLAERYQGNQPYDPLYFENFLADDVALAMAREFPRHRDRAWTDFTMHCTRPGWRRRCNLIVYLNEGWDEAWGGNIDFWAPEMSSVIASYPAFLNTAVLFNTPGALHGFPDPLTCPPTVARKSMQFYYYTIDESPSSTTQATAYHARPDDHRLKKVFIALDNVALAVYSWLKRRLGLSDALVSQVLRFFGRGQD